MARDDRFKKYQAAGADFLEVARSRAEDFLRELAKVSDETQKQAQGAVDELVDGSRRGTEQILAFIRREITTQLAALGIVTTRPSGGSSSAPTAAPVKKAAATTRTATKKAAGVKKAAPVKKAAATTRTATKKAAGVKKATPAKRATAKKAAGGA